MPMGEFWLGHGRSADVFNICNKAMASSAHVYGRPVVAAEAFTANPVDTKYQNHPFSLKPLGDLASTWGINWFVMSQFMMQPWGGPGPGMTLGPFGTQYDRGITSVGADRTLAYIPGALPNVAAERFIYCRCCLPWQ